MTKNIIYRLISKAINFALHADPDSQSRIKQLNNKIVRIIIEDWDISIDMQFMNENIQINSINNDIKPDCIIRSKLTTLIKASQQRRRKKAALTPGIHIEGYSHTAEAMWRLLGDLDIDWEEKISSIVGDGAAFRIGQVFRQGKKTFLKQRQIIAKQATSYLQNEAQLLPNSKEIINWQQQVNILRNDVDRIEAKVNKITQLLHNH